MFTYCVSISLDTNTHASHHLSHVITHRVNDQNHSVIILTSIGRKSNGVNDQTSCIRNPPSEIWYFFIAMKHMPIDTMISSRTWSLTPHIKMLIFPFIKFALLFASTLNSKKTISMLILWSCSTLSLWRTDSYVKNLLLISSILFYSSSKIFFNSIKKKHLKATTWACLPRSLQLFMYNDV